ncbi:MAG TPA: ABC transporter permease [Gammaproteobacteria bacterium]|nr:ABC transporter permease [Gammaproteobacteria bacterium]
MNELKQALRRTLAQPGLSFVMIAMLALGLGATTAMYSIYHEVLERPLPVAEPERLVNFGAPGPKRGFTSCSTAGNCDEIFSYPMFRDLEARQTAFAGIAGHSAFGANLSYRGGAISAQGALVSGGYFSVLGVRPALGRLIGPQDEPRVGESAVAVLDYAYWRDYLGADPGAIGQTLIVNGQALTIVGVAPEGFFGTTWGVHPKVFVPLSLRGLMEPNMPRGEDSRTTYWVYLFARLAPGGSIDQAATAINALYSGILNEVEAALNSDMPPDMLEQFRRRTITLAPGALGQSWMRDISTPLTLLLGVTALVLLIACANIANLLLARGVARSGEMALRASLGASRARLVGQLLLEATVVAALGGLATLPVAALTQRAILALAPDQIATQITVDFSGRAMLFAGTAALATVLLFGLFPALQATRATLGTVIKGQAAQSVGGRGAARFRTTLATVQIALSTVLLVLAGLFAHSLVNIASVDLGMGVDSVVSFSVAPRQNGYTQERTTETFDRIESELAAVPGVTSVTSSSVALLANNFCGIGLNVEGFDAPAGADTSSSCSWVSPGFLRTLSVPLLTGREFTAADGPGAPQVAIVNQAFVRKFGLGDAPLGKHFGMGDAKTAERNIEIVGIAADAKYNTVKGEIPPLFLLPRRQESRIGQLSIYVRGAVEPQALLAAIPRVVASVDPTLPVQELTTMRKTVESSVFLDRLVAILSAAFATLATVLAAIGLYGVLAYNVAQRTREIGIKLALGATPQHVRATVVKQVASMAAIGMTAGLIVSIAVGRGAGSLLYGLSGYDPAALVGAVAALAAVVAAAAYLPARRVAGVAPMEALRYE